MLFHLYDIQHVDLVVSFVFFWSVKDTERERNGKIVSSPWLEEPKEEKKNTKN